MKRSDPTKKGYCTSSAAVQSGAPRATSPSDGAIQQKEPAAKRTPPAKNETETQYGTDVGRKPHHTRRRRGPDGSRSTSGRRPRRYARLRYRSSVPSGSVRITSVTNVNRIGSRSARCETSDVRAYDDDGSRLADASASTCARRKPPGFARSDAVPISGCSRNCMSVSVEPWRGGFRDGVAS